jgi:NodT family efflux transporter outer membrane factor (OMF) lipoprotein
MLLRPCLVAAAAAALLSACAAGPDYVRPALDVPAAYKETGDWKTAQPQPVADGHDWWRVWGDATLDGLMRDAAAANQDIALAEAQVREARALADAARASLFPTLGLSADAGRSRARTSTGGISTGNSFSAGLSASWEPDLWGSVRRGIEAGDASAQASADDLAAARLSIQTTLAQDYVALRIVDAQRDLYATTIAGYAKALKLTSAQRAAGIVLQSDAQAQAAAVDLDATRAQLEHALAVLTGRAPARFALAPLPAGQFTMLPPPSPAELPSALLEHRPDIAAAERRAAEANANIGVAKAAYFPQLTLSGSGGFGAATLGTLFDTPSRVWSLGAALAQTVFDGGLRRAHTAQAEAAYDATAAQYKQAVLSALQQVEDNLATLRLLDQESVFQDQAVRSAQLAEQLALNQYRGGTNSYLNLVTAQAQSLSTQRAAVVLRGRQLAAAITLISATGGGWSTSDPVASATVPAQPQ